MNSISKLSHHNEDEVYQIAYIVPDLEKAASHWLKQGVGPFFKLGPMRFPQVHHPSESESPNISILFAYSGTMLLELIEVHDDPAGIYDLAAVPGPHHIARLARDLGARIQEQKELGHPCVFHATLDGGASVAYVDTRSTLGMLTEFVSLDEGVMWMLNHMYAASLTFDGTDPIREFAE